MDNYVDVVMPVLNSSKYVAEAIDSAIDQGPSIRKILIIDNGSTDGTIEILDAYRAKFKKVNILHCSAIGVSAARNLGIEASDSPFIAFLDSDDVWLGGKIDLQLASMKENPAVVMSFMNYCEIDKMGKISKKPTSQRNISRISPTDLLSFHKSISGSASNTLIKREALDLSGYFRNDLDFAEDLDLWIRLSRVGEIQGLDEVGVKIRVHDNSATRKRYAGELSYRNSLGILKVYESNLDLLGEDFDLLPLIKVMWSDIRSNLLQSFIKPWILNKLVVGSAPDILKRLRFSRLSRFHFPLCILIARVVRK